MSRYEAIESRTHWLIAAARALSHLACDVCVAGTAKEHKILCDRGRELDMAISATEAALALPDDSKVVNAELYGLAVELADWTAKYRLELAGLNLPLYRIERNSLRYLSLREQSGEPMPYKVVRDGDKVRFDEPAPPKDGE